MISDWNRLSWRQISSEGTWILVGQIGSLIGALVGVRIMTELLAPASYGELALGLTLSTLITQTAFAPIGSGLARYYSLSRMAGTAGNYLNSAFGLLMIPSSAVFAVVLFVACGGTTRLRIGSGLLITALVFAVANGARGAVNSIQIAARSRRSVAVHQILDSWIRFGLAGLLISVFGRTSACALLGYALASCMLLISQSTVLRSEFGPCAVGGTDTWNGKIWRYSWPLAVTGVLSWASTASQRWALYFSSGTVDVGHFNALYQIGFNPFTVAGNSLFAFAMPVVFDRSGEGADPRRMASIFRGIGVLCGFGLLLVITITLLVTALHSQIFAVFAARQYWQVSKYLPLVVITAGLSQISVFLTLAVLASAETTRLLAVNTVGNGAILVMNFIGAHYYGLRGLVVAMPVGAAVYLAWNVYNTIDLIRSPRSRC